MVGCKGIVTTGDHGTATAGEKGTAIAGVWGTAQAGELGRIQIEYWDGTRRRIKTGYIGEDGLEPDVAYKLDDEFNFVPADCPQEE